MAQAQQQTTLGWRFAATSISYIQDTNATPRRIPIKNLSMKFRRLPEMLFLTQKNPGGMQFIPQYKLFVRIQVLPKKGNEVIESSGDGIGTLTLILGMALDSYPRHPNTS